MLCIYCNEEEAIHFCPDPTCPDVPMMCDACDEIFKFCPDHVYSQIEGFTWDPKLPADANRAMARAVLYGRVDESGALRCPACGGTERLQREPVYSGTLGALGEAYRVRCTSCGRIASERVEWDAASNPMLRTKLMRWKQMVGALEEELRYAHVMRADGTEDTYPLHPEWEILLGEDLARRLREIMKEVRLKLYAHSAPLQNG